MMTACLFLFMEGLLTQVVGQLNLSNTSKLDEPSSLLLFSSTCRASNLLRTGTWYGGVVIEETRLLRRAGTCRHSSHPLFTAFSQMERGQGILCIVCPACLSGLSQGTCNSSRLSLSWTPWYFSTYSPPPFSLSLSGGAPLPGHTSHRCAHCCCPVLAFMEGMKKNGKEWKRRIFCKSVEGCNEGWMMTYRVK